jgi:hypothetical protein
MKEACVVYMSMGPWLFAVNNLTIDLSTIRETIRRRQTPSGHRSAHALAYTSSLTTNLASYQKKKHNLASTDWLLEIKPTFHLAQVALAKWPLA